MSSNKFPPVPSAIIAAMILHEALDGDSEVYEYCPAKRTPNSIREFVIEYLRKNIGEDAAKLSNVRPYLYAIWRSIFLEIEDILKPSEPNGGSTRISRTGELTDEEHAVELLSTTEESKEIRIRKKLISRSPAPSDRMIY